MGIELIHVYKASYFKHKRNYLQYVVRAEEEEEEYCDARESKWNISNIVIGDNLVHTLKYSDLLLHQITLYFLQI